MKTAYVLLLLCAQALASALADEHYVSKNGSNTSPYTSWPTAARAIDSAIAQSSDGDTVLVSNGVYTLSAQISVTKGVAIRSLNGPSDTVIDGNNATPCVYMSHANASLTGFTVRNGYGLDQLGGGVYIDGYDTGGGGTVDRCVIRDNRVHASSSGSGVLGGGVFLSTSGTVRNCLIMNNRADSGGSKSAEGGGLFLSHGGTVESCTIVSNSAKAFGGYYVLFYGTLKNSIAYYNVKTDGTPSNGGYEFFPLQTTGVYFNYCCSTPVLDGTGNTASAPLFVNPWAQDYRLSASSPCIDTGTPSGAPAVDLDGLPRPLDGNGNGVAVVDIGAYEYAQTAIVAFDAQSGTVSPASATVTNSLPYGLLPVPARTGYSFGGWWTGAAGAGTQVTGSTTVTTGVNHTLYAKWTANTYTVTFDAVGGAVNPGSKTVTYDSIYGTLPTPTQTGYLFGGWWTSRGGTGTRVTSSATVSITADQTLYACWASDAFMVTLGSNAVPVGNTNAVQTVIDNSGDGGTSVKLGGVGLLADNGMAGIEWSVTGPGVLAFDWKVSSEEGFDGLRFYEVGGSSTNFISGTGADWAHVTLTVLGAADADHTFRWEYFKDGSEYVGFDCGWVDAVQWLPVYSLTVNNGSGDRYYTNRAPVAIMADAPATHYTFYRWTGDTNGVVDVFSSSTTLVMPATGVVVTAIYTPILYPLSVSNGSGGGSYPYASTVAIGATPFTGKHFYRWTGDVDTVANVAAATTTVVTAGHTLSVIATYSVPLTVNTGTGGGWYPEGATTTVSADPDPMYMEFAAWTGDAAGLLADPTASVTTLGIPTRPSALTATYRDSVARVAGCYGRTFTQSGIAGGVSADAAAGSPSATPAVKLGGAGVVPDNGFAAFENVVSGSGAVTFWWKVSSESNADYLKFKVDGVQIAAISGTKGSWAQVSNRVEGAGVSHTLRWEYAKNGSLASSTDAGWVDEIVWTGDVPNPVIRPDIRTTAATNNVFAFTFLGERGIPYTVYSNATLSTSGWAPMNIVPQEKGETNGVFRFETIVLPPVGQRSGFYRIIGGAAP